jgi:hypothetical protein
MRASIRRHGIAIRSVELSGNIAKIGSGEQCEIRIEDPYLAAHVADVINRADGWYIADTATSLEGITRGGGRVDEEKIVSGEPYSIGGFELLFEGGGPSQASASNQGQAGVLPRTMVEPLPPSARQGAGNVEMPRTVVDMPIPGAQPAAAASPGGPQFRPMATAHNVAVPQAAQMMPQAQMHPGQPAPRKSRRGLLVIAALGMVMLLVVLVAVLAMMGGKKKPASQTTATSVPTPQPTAAPTPPPVDPLAAGNKFASELQMDRALASWEEALQKAPSPELQKKYAQAAYEIALVYAAANDSAKARAHFEKVAKYGVPESAEVKAAKARLGG